MRALVRAFLRGVATVLIFALFAGCGYSPVRPYSGRGFSLGVLRNSTDEPLLYRTMEDSLAEVAGLRRTDAPRKVSIVITEFSERAQTVSSQGDPVREELTLGFLWRIVGEDGKLLRKGKERVARSYPWSTDINTLDWSRRAAIRLLSKDAARALSDRLEDQP